MQLKHSDLLGPSGRDDADVRGEHSYPDRKRAREHVKEDQLAPTDERPSYVAGSDGTEIVTPGVEAGGGDERDDHSS